MKSSIVKRSITIDGHKTSVSLEEAFWSDLKQIACAEEATLPQLVAKIDHTREWGTLSSALRLYVLEHIHLIGRAQSWRGAGWISAAIGWLDRRPVLALRQVPSDFLS